MQLPERGLTSRAINFSGETDKQMKKEKLHDSQSHWLHFPFVSTLKLLWMRMFEVVNAKQAHHSYRILHNQFEFEAFISSALYQHSTLEIAARRETRLGLFGNYHQDE